MTAVTKIVAEDERVWEELRAVHARRIPVGEPISPILVGMNPFVRSGLPVRLEPLEDGNSHADAVFDLVVDEGVIVVYTMASL